MKYTHFLRPLAWLLLAIALSGHKHGNHGSRIKTLTPNQLTVCAFPEFPPVVNVDGQGEWVDLRRRLEGADLSDSVEVVNSITEAESVQRVRDKEVLGFAIGTVTAFYLSEGDEELKTTWCHPLLEDDGREGVDEFSFVVRERSTGLVKALNKYIDRTEYGLGDTVGCPEG